MRLFPRFQPGDPCRSRGPEEQRDCPRALDTTRAAAHAQHRERGARRAEWPVATEEEAEAFRSHGQRRTSLLNFTSTWQTCTFKTEYKA